MSSVSKYHNFEWLIGLALKQIPNLPNIKLVSYEVLRDEWSDGFSVFLRYSVNNKPAYYRFIIDQDAVRITRDSRALYDLLVNQIYQASKQVSKLYGSKVAFDTNTGINTHNELGEISL